MNYRRVYIAITFFFSWILNIQLAAKLRRVIKMHFINEQQLIGLNTLIALNNTLCVCEEHHLNKHGVSLIGKSFIFNCYLYSLKR